MHRVFLPCDLEDSVGDDVADDEKKKALVLDKTTDPIGPKLPLSSGHS